MLKVTIKRLGRGYQGRVEYYRDNLKLWRVDTGIFRLTKEDAEKDALLLRADMIEMSYN